MWSWWIWQDSAWAESTLGMWSAESRAQSSSPTTNLVWASFLVLYLFAYCVSLSTYLNLK